MKKIPVYFMPGLAAGPKIFERIKLPEDKYQIHFLEWIVPQSEDESLKNYVLRLSHKIKEEKPILVGVSFGGIIVQEMAKYIDTSKVIIVSSIKSEKELPKRLKILQLTKAYKLFPSKKIEQLDDFNQLAILPSLKKKTKLYNDYMQMKNHVYFNWALKQVLNWTSDKTLDNLTHIHGDKDGIFPIKHIKDCIEIPGGTHAMIVTKTPRINTVLQEII